MTYKVTDTGAFTAARPARTLEMTFLDAETCARASKLGSSWSETQTLTKEQLYQAREDPRYLKYVNQSFLLDVFTHFYQMANTEGLL